MENITEISLTEGCNLLSRGFKTEKDFVEDLIPKLNDIIKAMYGYTVKRYQTERHYKILKAGYFNAFIDIYVETEEGVDIVIECKNPKQIKSETFAAFSQIMSYEFLLENVYGKEKQIKYIIATSVFDFVFFQFMKRFNLKYDLILNNVDSVGFWTNDL